MSVGVARPKFSYFLTYWISIRLEREKKMYREMKKMRKGTAGSSKSGGTSEGGSSSSEELNFDNAELHGKLMTNKELKEQLKQKRTKKVWKILI